MDTAKFSHQINEISGRNAPLDSIKYGPWGRGQFAAMVKRHMAMKQKYPDRKPTNGIPYEGIENVRPESKKVIELFMAGQPQK